MTHVTKTTKRTMRTAGILFSMLAVLITTGCEEFDEDPAFGEPFNVVLPTDTLLNLACSDAGVYDPEANNTCILNDPENPFIGVGISEFDVALDEEGLPQPPSYKLNIYGGLPAGPAGAKARFYLMATALANFPSGENQYYTALALHELYSDSLDPVIQQQAINAYRAVLDHFFGTVTFFEIAGSAIPFELNLLTADNLYRDAAQPAFLPLLGTTPLLIQEVIGGWGYRYTPCDDLLAADPNACPVRGDLTIISVP